MRHTFLSVVLAIVAWAAPPTAVGHAPTADAPVEIAIFAGGRFWCLEDDLARIRGVIDVETGFTGGDAPPGDAATAAVDAGGHVEAVRVTFDPAATSYRRVLLSFWLSIDPLDAEGQFCERGARYRTAIFVAGPDQAAAATASRLQVARTLGREVATVVRPAVAFWLAEERQQDYARKNPQRYDFYRRSCGRDAGLRAVWDGVPLDALEP